MAPRPRPPQRRFPIGRVLATSLFLSALLVVAVAARLAVSRDESSFALDLVLNDTFQELGVDRARMTAQTVSAPDGARVSELKVDLPEDGTYARVNAEVSRAVESTGARVLDAIETGGSPERPDGLEMQLGRGSEVTHRIRVRPPEPRRPDTVPDGVPRVALVFDDLGYTLGGMARELLELDVPITFAVLPGLAHSEEFAREARARGHHVILHVPMQPLDRARHDPGRNALDPALPRQENLRRLRLHLDALSAYDGVSNHMGSAATAEASLVDLVVRELRGRNETLFILDSRTTPYSVVPARAKAAGVRHAANNLFLDASDEDGTIAGIQARRVSSIARRRGSAIAIGHVRRDTIDAVRAALDDWQREGIQLVALADLMHR